MDWKATGKRLALGLAVAVAVAACTPAQVEAVCAREDMLHNVYMNYVAPTRSEAQVLDAIKFHERAQALCAVGADLAVVLDASNDAGTARSK